MDWLYRFASNDDYPDPLEEIDALCTIDDAGERAFLLLGDRPSPPMCGAAAGEIVGLCTETDGRLFLHGTGVIDGPCIHGTTPTSVEALYGHHKGRTFSPLVDLVRLPTGPLGEEVLNHEEQAKFLKGKAYVKLVGASKPPRKKARHGAASIQPSGPAVLPAEYDFPRFRMAEHRSRFVVAGLDPTAGTWVSKMSEGPKKMPSFTLIWDGSTFQLDHVPVRQHKTNVEFWNDAQEASVSVICIDGPCDTSGPRLLPDHSGWQPNAGGTTRAGEVLLSRAGVNLFWTTQNTVMKFDGASRWIARSLVMFDERPEFKKIETHPHGAFSFLWRLFGQSMPLPKKSKPHGREARLAMLRAFISGLTDDMVPDHDAVDAACAALVAAFHQLGLTKPFGTELAGGIIWMPDIETLTNQFDAEQG